MENKENNTQESTMFCALHQQAIIEVCFNDKIMLCSECQKTNRHKDHKIIPIQSAIQQSEIYFNYFKTIKSKVYQNIDSVIFLINNFKKRFQSFQESDLKLKIDHNLDTLLNTIQRAQEDLKKKFENHINYEALNMDLKMMNIEVEKWILGIEEIDVWTNFKQKFNEIQPLLQNNSSPTPEEIYSSLVTLEELQNYIEGIPEGIIVGILGRTHYKQGKKSESVPLIKRSFSMCLNYLGKGHPICAQCYCSMGSLNIDDEKTFDGKEMYEKGLKLSQSVFGDEHIYSADNINGMGAFHWQLGQYGKALECYEKVLRLRIKFYGEIHAEVGSSYYNLGAIYSSQGKFKEAIEALEKAYKIWTQFYGEIHPETGHSYSSFGVIYNIQGKYDDAEKSFLQAVKIWKEYYGSYHSDVVYGLNSLAYIYCNKKNYTKAMKYHTEALRIIMQLNGSQSEEFASCIRDISEIFYKHYNIPEALASFRKVLLINRIKPTPFNLDYLRASMSIEYITKKGEIFSRFSD